MRCDLANVFIQYKTLSTIQPIFIGLIGMNPAWWGSGKVNAALARNHLDPIYSAKYVIFISYQMNLQNQVGRELPKAGDLRWCRSHFSVHHPCSKHNNNCTDMCIPVPEPSVVYGVDSMNKDLKGLCTCGKHINSECNASKRTAVPPVSTPPVAVTECQQNITVVAPHCEDSVLMNYSVSAGSVYSIIRMSQSNRCSMYNPVGLSQLYKPSGRATIPT